MSTAVVGVGLHRRVPVSRSLGLFAVFVAVLAVSALGFAELGARVFVGAFLVAAGAAKLLDLPAFGRVLRQFPLARVVASSPGRARFLGVAVASSEVLLGGLFAAGFGLPLVGALVVAQLLVFTGGLVLVLARGVRLPCGCLGRHGGREIQWPTVARNLALIGLAAIGTGTTLQLAAPAPVALAALCICAGTVAALAARPTGRRRSILVVRATPMAKLAARASSLMVMVVQRLRSLIRLGPGRKAPPSRVDRSPDLQPLFEEILQDEEAIVELTLGLERRLAEVAPLDLAYEPPTKGSDTHMFRLAPKPTEKRRDTLDDESQQLERRLVELDSVLNARISNLYRSAAEKSGGESALVRAALLHWTILLRRHSLGGFHTSVPVLAEDPDCAEDLIGDRLLQHYFEALFARSPDLHGEVAAVRALARIARQTVCLGTQQSALLASRLYWSFVELRSFLRANGLEAVMPAVAQAASSPLLLFYDVEKWRGVQAPLARWFVDQREALAQGVLTRRHPAFWHGLWLYDRRSGHLIGYRPTDTADDENDIRLERFFTSIVMRENLGKFDCSFAEMVERGVGPQGYLCAGSVCAQASANEADRRAGQHGARRRRVRNLAAAFRELGFSAEVAASAGCGQRPTGGQGAGGCGGGLNAAGRERLSATIRCLTERAISPTERAMQCIAEATGRCSNPLDKMAKDLHAALFPGIKVPPGCAASADGGTDDDGTADDAGTEGDGDENGDGETSGTTTEAPPKVKIDTQTGTVEVQSDHPLTADEIDAALQSASDQLTDAGLDALGELENAEASGDQTRIDAARDQFKEVVAAMRIVDATISKRKGQAGRCPPDTPECGSNNCTAMSEAARQTMACLEIMQPKPEAMATFGGVQPGVFDPSPLDDSASPAWLSCFDAIGDERPVGAKQCWAYDCGPESRTIELSGGRCGCGGVEGVLGGKGMKGNCGALDCPPESSPTFEGGRCSCAPQGGWGGGQPAPAPFTLPMPQPFTDARSADALTMVAPAMSQPRLPVEMTIG